MFVHIDIYSSQNDYFKQEIYVWNVCEACCVKANSPCVESKYIGIFHQRSASANKTVANIFGKSRQTAKLLLSHLFESLKFGRLAFLTAAVKGIVVVV